jgi:DNA-binding transcriptional LysR family regulator
MFRWDDLGVLLAVHRRGTLAGAAEDLRVNPSTVSRRLRALEDDLGARLVDRTPDGLRATDLAIRLLPHAEQAETAANAAAAEAAGEDRAPEGRVRVACAEGFGVYVIAPLLPAFFEQNPGIQVDLSVSTDVVDLSRREADIAIRFVRPTDGDLVMRRVAASPGYAGFVSQDYARRHADLSVESVDWIGWSESKAHLPEAQLFERLVGRPARFRCDNLVVMMEAMRAGAGAVLLPMAFRLPGAVQVPGTVMVDAEVPVFVVTHRALRDVPRVRVVSDWLVEVLSGLAARITSLEEGVMEAEVMEKGAAGEGTLT